MKRLAATFSIALCVAWPAMLWAQSSKCENVGARRAWEARTNPVYADATDLGRTLSGRGFVVECIRDSKEWHMFTDQKGAAWFKTNQGIFEVWFFPSAEDVDGLQLPTGEQRLVGGPSQFYIRKGNMVFHVMGNKQLALNIQSASLQP